ncbi:MAG: hypothetical protein RLZ07_1589 [Pseudomonadota bacterium]|jgi:hypothetical protein
MFEKQIPFRKAYKLDEIAFNRLCVHFYSYTKSAIKIKFEFSDGSKVSYDINEEMIGNFPFNEKINQPEILDGFFISSGDYRIKKHASLRLRDLQSDLHFEYDGAEQDSNFEREIKIEINSREMPYSLLYLINLTYFSFFCTAITIGSIFTLFKLDYPFLIGFIPLYLLFAFESIRKWFFPKFIILNRKDLSHIRYIKIAIYFILTIIITYVGEKLLDKIFQLILS